MIDADKYREFINACYAVDGVISGEARRARTRDRDAHILVLHADGKSYGEISVILAYSPRFSRQTITRQQVGEIVRRDKVNYGERLRKAISARQALAKAAGLTVPQADTLLADHAALARQVPTSALSPVRNADSAERVVVVLCTRTDTIYNKLRGLNAPTQILCYDKKSDMRTYTGQHVVIAHPPCADYCNFKHLHPRNPARAALARQCITIVQNNGGVLEHPAGSALWREAGLPWPGEGKDVHGGYAVYCEQGDYGHVTRKATWLYIVGGTTPAPAARQPLASKAEQARHLWGGDRCTDYRAKYGASREALREATPRKFAEFLLSIAMSCSP